MMSIDRLLIWLLGDGHPDTQRLVHLRSEMNQMDDVIDGRLPETEARPPDGDDYDRLYSIVRYWTRPL